MEPITASAARLAGSSLLRVQSDARLAELASLDNDAAFEALVKRYRAPLLRACRRFLPNDRAEDAVQHAFLRAHQALLRNGPPERFRPWLHKIAVNAALGLTSEHEETLPLDAERVDGVEQPDEAIERRDQLSATVGAIHSLPVGQRRALVLREFEGRSHDEIARELGLSAGAARQLIHRARTALRSTASALVPPALLVRLLAAGGSETTHQVAEAAVGGAAGATATKVAVAALVAGGVAGGVALERSNESRDAARAEALERPSPDEDGSGLSAGGGGAESSTGSGGGNSGPGGSGEGDGGSDGGEGDSSGPGSGGSGDADGSGSGSSGSGSSGSGSSGPGSSGDDFDDPDEHDSSGSGSSGSGSSGSGTSGSDSSGSGSSDSDSSGSGSSGSGSGSDTSGSGSSGSDTSGSGSSGSGSSGSGSGDLDPAAE
jgi:RNA polymerase sigma factor (sigma-70 family)